MFKSYTGFGDDGNEIISQDKFSLARLDSSNNKEFVLVARPAKDRLDLGLVDLISGEEFLSYSVNKVAPVREQYIFPTRARILGANKLWVSCWNFHEDDRQGGLVLEIDGEDCTFKAREFREALCSWQERRNNCFFWKLDREMGQMVIYKLS